MNWSISFIPFVPWPVLWIVAAVGAVLIALLFWRARRGAAMRLLAFAALLLALRDLARDPAHWRKTEHGAVVRGGAGAISGGLGAPGTIPCPHGHESPMFSQCSHGPAEETR